MGDQFSLKERIIVIGAQPYGESDLILRVIAEKVGKLSLMAKHARSTTKRFGARLDIFDCGKAEAQPGRGSLPLLQSFIPEKSFLGLRNSLVKLCAASLVCECFDFLLLEGHEEPTEAYDLIITGLAAIDQGTSAAHLAAAVFDSVSTLLEVSGFAEPSEFEPRGLKNLERLIRRVEEVAERGLKSREGLKTLLDAIRKELPPAASVNE